MAHATSIFEQILDPANRANPYPLYAELRKTPVEQEADGTWVVSTYAEVEQLLHDPRVSSDLRNCAQVTEGTPAGDLAAEAALPELPPAFIRLDPPEHDRLRELAMRPFGPPHSPERVEGMRSWVRDTTTALIDGLVGIEQIDIVDDFAYPLPVSVICELLGVPREDEPHFHELADALIDAGDPNSGTLAERQRRAARVRAELGAYLSGLTDAHLRDRGDDLLSELLSGGDRVERMTREELLSSAVLLLVAGHETTVNLIANGMLTLLRHPEVFARLRREPELIIGFVEELLRHEPPVHFLPTRTALADIDLAGTTIPAGAPITVVLAAANRDPNRFPNPDRFDPDRTDNQHLSFGSGIHYCYGAPLARMETQIALTELARRLVNPRLLTDPPPYRASPFLRGPRHLIIEVDDMARGKPAARARTGRHRQNRRSPRRTPPVSR
jgi:cytochrome P450